MGLEDLGFSGHLVKLPIIKKIARVAKKNLYQTSDLKLHSIAWVLRVYGLGCSGHLVKLCRISLFIPAKY
jgi:hypothetical protein